MKKTDLLAGPHTQANLESQELLGLFASAYIFLRCYKHTNSDLKFEF